MNTYPLSQSQLGVYLEHIQLPESTQYNLPSCTHMPSTIDIDRLESAFRKVLDERKELRTRFMIDQNGEVRQWSDDTMQIPVIRRKCTEADLHAYIDKDFVRPFDLLSGEPLFRVELVETEKGICQLVDGHHSITDGMSFTPVIFQMDLTRAYAGLELEPNDYGMYEAAEEEVASFGNEAYERAKAYYAEKFAGVDFATISKSEQGTMGKMVRRSSFINHKLCDEWCNVNGTQVNLLFQAAFSYVVSVLTRQEKVAYFTVNHGRMDKRLRHSIGMFVKSVPIMANVVGATKVIDFIKSLRTEMMSTIRYGAYPFNHLCRDLKMSPGLSFNFQAIAGMEEAVILGDEKISLVQPIRQEVNEDMTVFIFFKEDDYEIRAESSCAMNDETTLQMMADAICATVKNIMANPDADLQDISIVGEKEKANLIALGKGEECLYDQTKTFIDLFGEQVALHPDSTAVVDEVGSLTYAELDRRSDLLAHALADSGVGPDKFVAVMLPRTKEFLVSVLGVFKAGGAYIPMDNDYPNDRLLYMLDDSQAKVLITTRELFDEKCTEGEFKADNILFVDEFDFSATCSSINHSRPESLAYMIYTSGSTGKPKGVMIEHQAMLNLIQFIIKRFGLSVDSRIGFHSNFGFDVSIEDLFPTLSVGGTLHILSTELRDHPSKLYDYICHHRLTGGGYTTQHGVLMASLYDLPSDYYISLGGEKLASNPTTKARIYNMYGPTEFTVDATYFELESGKQYQNIPIGRPLYNLSAYIVDSLGQLLPRGMAGELCMAGPQIARGYWNRPELTAEKFIDCPFLEGEQMYRTGDLAHWNEDGELEYLGRIDTQVKLRGFRIELGEIESAISKYEGIQSAVVEVKEIGNAQHLCGYYTSAAAVDEEKLGQYLSETLAEYMVPTAFVRLDAMPLTPNGKVNRKELPTPEIKAEEIVAPTTGKEEMLFDIVKNLLSTEEFGVSTDLIRMGLTSLSAIKLVAMANKKGLKLKVNDVLKHKTIRKMLSQEMSLGFWANDPQVDKPIVVVIHGLSNHIQLKPLTTRLVETYSVFVVEPLEEHYHYIFQGEDKAEVIQMYTALLDLLLPENSSVYAFIGHSYGGELAYRCAVQWKEMTAQQPQVILFDTFVGVEEHQAELPDNPPLETLSAAVAQEVAARVRQSEILAALADGIPLPSYQGNVTLFKALRQEQPESLDAMNFTLFIEQNEERWRTFVPQIKVVGVEADHYGMMAQEHVDLHLTV